MGNGYIKALSEANSFENAVHDSLAQIHSLVNRNKVSENRIDSECRRKIADFESAENSSKRKEQDTKAALIHYAEESTKHVNQGIKSIKDPNFQRIKAELIAELGTQEVHDELTADIEGLSPGQLIVKTDEETTKFDKSLSELEHAFLPPFVSRIVGRFSDNFRKEIYRRILMSAKCISVYAQRLESFREDSLTVLRTENAKGKALAQKERAEKLAEAEQELLHQVKAVLANFANNADKILERAVIFSQGSIDIGRVTVRGKDCDLLAAAPTGKTYDIRFEKDGVSFPFRIGSVCENLLFAADSGKRSAEVLGMLAGKILSFSGRSEIILADIKGLGSTYPELMPLAKYSSVKVWNSTDKVAQGLAGIESYIAGMYENLNHTDNCRAGGCEMSDSAKSSLGKPGNRYIFINDIPQNIPASCYEQLMRIIENGNAAGVYVLAAFNPAYLGDSRSINEFMSAIKARMVNVTLKGNIARLGGSSELAFYTSLSSGEKRALAANMLKTAEKRKILPIGPTLPPAGRWQMKDSSKGISIPIGAGENGKMIYLVFSAERPYAMIIGDVRVGKSSLLHSIIIQTLANYSPREVRLAVGDFKYGADFNIYAQGNIKALDAVINSEDPDAMMSFLQHYLNELYARRVLFSEMSDASGEIILKYEDYRRVAEKYGGSMPEMPRILILIDEFQNVFDVPACAQLMTQLVQKGATYGIHVVLSGQRASSDNPRNSFTSGLKDYFTSRFVFMTPQTAARSMLSERCADTGRENSGIQRAPLLKKGQAVYNSYLGQNEADNAVLQCCFASTDVIGSFIRVIRRMNGQGNCVLLERSAKSVKCPDKPDGLLRIGTSVMLHRDSFKNCCDFIFDDTEVILQKDRAKNILLSGADARMHESLLMSLFINKLSAPDKSMRIHIFGAATRLASLMSCSEGVYLHQTIDEQLEEIDRQISESGSEYNVNFFLEPDKYTEYHQGSGSLRNSAGAEKLKKLLSRTEEGHGFCILYAKAFKALRNSMSYAGSLAPVSIVSVGDAENVRAALSDNFKTSAEAFDAPSATAIKAYYFNRETNKTGKVILYAP